MSLPRLLLADDHTLVAEGIVRLLQSEFDLVEVVADGAAAVEAARKFQPDLVVLDFTMPLLNGVEAARSILKENPRTKIIFLTMHTDVTYAAEALRAGAVGYISKQEGAAGLMAAMRTIAGGGTYVTAPIARELRELEQRRDRPQNPLTARQVEVLKLVADGKSAKELAATLGISVKTAEFHKANIMQKLGLRTTADLTKYALVHGISK